MADPDLPATAASALDRRKQAMRAEFARQLRGHSPSTASAEAAAGHLVRSESFRGARSLALYAALPDELSTVPIFRSAIAACKRCLFPLVSRDGGLAFVPVLRWEDLRPGRYGVLEPESAIPEVALAEVDLILVPGVAFDRSGRRLGRGRGYYDRALARGRAGGRPFAIGLVESCRLVDEVPAGMLDEPVDAVLTERGWIAVARSEPELRGPM